MQDILFAAHLHPKKKLKDLKAEEKEQILKCTVATLQEMSDKGGRDTEKDMFGTPGGYQTRFSKNTWKSNCPVCGSRNDFAIWMYFPEDIEDKSYKW